MKHVHKSITRTRILSQMVQLHSLTSCFCRYTLILSLRLLLGLRKYHLNELKRIKYGDINVTQCMVTTEVWTVVEIRRFSASC